MPLSDADKKEMIGMFGEALTPLANSIAGLAKDNGEFKVALTKLQEGAASVINLSEVPEEEKLAAGFADGDDDAAKLTKLRAYRATAGTPVTMGALKKTMLSFVKEVGGAAASASGGAGNTQLGGGGGGDAKGKATTTFMAKVDDIMTAAAMARPAAMAHAVRKFPDLHKAYLKEVGVGAKGE